MVILIYPSVTYNDIITLESFLTLSLYTQRSRARDASRATLFLAPWAACQTRGALVSPPSLLEQSSDWTWWNVVSVRVPERNHSPERKDCHASCSYGGGGKELLIHYLKSQLLNLQSSM